MTRATPEIVVLRKGTEGLSTEDYAAELRSRFPDRRIGHARTPEEERELIRHARVATGISISEALIEVAEDLELFVAASSGTGHLPTDALAESGVTVANASGIHAPGIAEQAIGYCLMFARRIHEGWSRMREGEWRHYQADEFGGSIVTVVGMGAIGQAVVERLAGFGVKTLGVRYTPGKGGPTDEVVGFDSGDVHEVLARTDYLVLATPLSETTEKLIGAEELATLPPSAVVVNVCRGGVVDTDALLASLQHEGIRGAAMDVTDPEPLPADHTLWNLDNVLITPHMGGHTPKHWERLAEILAENLRCLDEGEVDGFVNKVN